MGISFIFDMTLYGNMYPELAHYVRRFLKILRFILVLVFICNLDFKKSFIKQLLLFICFISFCFISNHHIRNWVIFDIFFAPVFLSGLIDRQRLVNIVFFAVSGAVLSVIILHFLNLLPDPVFYRGEKIRYALGFLHPNLLGFSLLFCCILFILKKRGLDRYGIVFLITLSVFCYFIPNSNTSCFLILVLMIFAAASDYLKKRPLSSVQTRLLAIVSCSFVVLIVAFSYLIIYTEILKDYIVLFPGELWARFSLAKVALDNYDVTLFGTKIAVDSNFTVDFAYTFIPISYGIVGFAFFMIFFIYSIKKSVYIKSYELLAVFILMSIYGISETVIFTPLFMFVFLCTYSKDYFKAEISS